MTTWPMISPTSNAFDTRVLTAAVYSFGYSFRSRTLVIVLPRAISTHHYPRPVRDEDSFTYMRLF